MGAFANVTVAQQAGKKARLERHRRRACGITVAFHLQLVSIVAQHVQNSGEYFVSLKQQGIKQSQSSCNNIHTLK